MTKQSWKSSNLQRIRFSNINKSACGCDRISSFVTFVFLHYFDMQGSQLFENSSNKNLIRIWEYIPCFAWFWVAYCNLLLSWDSSCIGTVESLINFCTHVSKNNIMPSYQCYLRYCQIFDKIVSFLKNCCKCLLQQEKHNTCLKNFLIYT